MSQFFKFSLLMVALIAVSGCASLAELDRDDLNRPGMDLRTRQTPAFRTLLTNVGSIQKSSGGGACTSCTR